MQLSLNDYGELIAPVSKYPHTNICTDENETLIIEVACPGFEKDMLNIEYVEDGINVRGEYPEDVEDTADFKYYQQHITIKDFLRKIKLSEEYHTEDINASYENGILTIVIPKNIPPEPERKIIEIS
jgi:HSP20 family protein